MPKPSDFLLGLVFGMLFMLFNPPEEIVIVKKECWKQTMPHTTSVMHQFPCP